MLWGLLFLKSYGTEERHVAQVGGVDEKTFRKWAWYYAEAIADLAPRVVSLCFVAIRCRSTFVFRLSNTRILSFLLRQVRWGDRYIGQKGTGDRAMITVDGTNYRVREICPFVKEINRKWCSHKSKSAGVRYEIAVCVRTGDIVWSNGPFKCSVPDITIFRSKLKRHLDPGEMVIADRGHRGEACIYTPDDAISEEHKIAMGVARARHETINGRLKQWNCLGHRWRHDRDKHHIAFRAVVAITQIEMDNGERPSQVQYDDVDEF